MTERRAFPPLHKWDLDPDPFAQFARRYEPARGEVPPADAMTVATVGEDGIDVGVQLVPAGSADERHFVGRRDRLRADPELRARYDELKRRHQGDGMDAYRAAKEALIQGLG